MYADINEYPPTEDVVAAPEDGAAALDEEVVVSVVEEEVATNVVTEVATEEISVVEEEAPATRRNRKKKADDIEIVTVITNTKNGSVGVDFRGFGLRLQTDTKYECGDIVQVRYEGIITTPNFKAELV